MLGWVDFSAHFLYLKFFVLTILSGRIYLKSDKYFKKATHNSFAYRIKQENGSLLEGKNDDWEIWAGMCILREIQRADFVNIVVVVTRFFWWILLQADRFKNVINSVKIIFEQDENN